MKAPLGEKGKSARGSREKIKKLRGSKSEQAKMDEIWFPPPGIQRQKPVGTRKLTYAKSAENEGVGLSEGHNHEKRTTGSRKILNVAQKTKTGCGALNKGGLKKSPQC